MAKIIACIDSSAYADNVCQLSAWAHAQTALPVSLLHVVAPQSAMEAKSNMSGQIGLNAKASLLEALTKLDEENAKLEQKKSQLMLQHAQDELISKGITDIEVLHRRGSLVETISELEAQADLIIMGKRGEQHHSAPGHLGSNLERVARAIHKPLLVAAAKSKPASKFLIAYDGSPSAAKAIDFAAQNPLLKGLEGHLLRASEDTPEAQKMLLQAKEKLNVAGAEVHTQLIKPSKPVEAIVAEYIAENHIDLLLIGAYGHSKIRSLILGSSTTALIRESHVPILLFR